MKRIFLLIVLMSYIFSGFSQTREDIKNITRDSVYCSIQNDSIKNYVKTNIDSLLNMKGKNLNELKEIFKNFIFQHNQHLNIYIFKKFQNKDWLATFLESIEIKKLKKEDLNSFMKVAINEAMIGERDTVIDGQKFKIFQKEYTEDEKGLLTALQRATGSILQNRYQVSIIEPEELTRKTTRRWYLKIINKALQEHPEKEKELTFLKEEIENF